MTSLLESLTLKLGTVVEIAAQNQNQDPENIPLHAKQALVRSTKEFKDALKEANEYAATLPGGDMSVEEQEEVIAMLEKLKQRKKRQFAEFANKVAGISSSQLQAQASLRMEVDSTASTPA